MTFVLDASALIAFATGEKGGALVEDLLADPRNQCFSHAVNLCEVYYDAWRRLGKIGATELLDDPAESGLQFRSDMDPDFWQSAGELKGKWRRISLADCFGLTLAARLGGEFVSADRHELEPLIGTANYQITFIR